MSSAKTQYAFFRLFLVAIICALPFLLGSILLYHHAERVDHLPLDRYGSLRWMPGQKDLAFLHQPLRQNPPAETELWRVSGSGTSYEQVGALEAGREWELTPFYSGAWMLLYGKRSDEDVQMTLADGTGKVKPLAIEAIWQLLPSQGDGLFFQTNDDSLPFDQFVDVEEASELDLSEGEQPDYLDYPEEESVEEPEPAVLPTRLGLKLGRLDPESGRVETLFSIPYDQPEQRPEVLLVRPSPDKRFLALIVRFGEVGAPGLWIYDSQTERLLWTRLRVKQRAHGLDWSSDSVKIALTDEDGLSILENVLGFEATRLKMESSERLTPSWGSGLNLFLHNEHAVYLVDKNRDQAEPLFETRGKAEAFDDLTLDGIGGRIAYTSAPRGYRELAVRDLKTGQSLARSALPGSVKEKAQEAVPYKLGNAIRYAWWRWTGRL